MHVQMTHHESARLRELAMARAAELRREALLGAWSALERWGARLIAHAAAARARAPQDRMG